MIILSQARWLCVYVCISHYFLNLIQMNFLLLNSVNRAGRVYYGEHKIKADILRNSIETKYSHESLYLLIRVLPFQMIVGIWAYFFQTSQIFEFFSFGL